MFGWGKKDKPKKKRNVPDVEIHVPELDIDRLEITLENLRAHVDVDARSSPDFSVISSKSYPYPTAP